MSNKANLALGFGDLGLGLGYDTSRQDCQFQMCEQDERQGEMEADERHIIV